MSAKQSIFEFNSKINVIAYPIFLDKHNANEIINNYDIVLDASDNVNARYMVNDAVIAN